MAIKKQWQRFRVAVVYNVSDYQVNQTFADALVAAFKAYGVGAALLQLSDAPHACVDLSSYDIIVNRTRRTGFLEHAKPTAMVFNDLETTVMANDKLKTYAWAQFSRIPALKTEPYDFREASKYQYPIVIKQVDGHGGQNVYKVDSAEVLDKLNLPQGKDFAVQEYCPAGTTDFRAYILFNKILCVVARDAAPGEWRANYSINRRARKVTLTLKEWIRLKRIASLLPPGYYGIDFFRTKKGFILNEVEDVVGARAVYALWPKIDLPRKYVRALFANLDRAKEYAQPALAFEQLRQND